MELYVVSDTEIFKVMSFNGAYIHCLDKTNWGISIPIVRVERFCDKNGNHIDFLL